MRECKHTDHTRRPHITIVFRQIISFTEATVFCLYTKLSKHDSCTQFYLINSYLHSGFNFNIQKKFVMCPAVNGKRCINGDPQQVKLPRPNNKINQNQTSIVIN